MKTTNTQPDRWVPDCPECSKKDHKWTRCKTGKKSNPGYFALEGNDYKLYEECRSCGTSRLIVVKNNIAKYSYRGPEPLASAQALAHFHGLWIKYFKPFKQPVFP